MMTVNTVNLEDHKPQTPLGLLLAPLISRIAPLQSQYTILIGWTRPYNKLGIVQKSGQIRIGDRLVEINEISVRNWTYEKIIRVLRCFDDGVRIRSLGFEVLKDESGIQNRTFNWSAAGRRLYSLKSSIRSYKIDANIARFEIRCQLVIRRSLKGNDEEVNWSTWKRYSELNSLHELLKKGFEWQLNGMNQGRGVSFPPNRTIQSIVYGPKSDGFLDRRRQELEDYWSLLQTCPDLFDFGDPTNHRFPKDMAEFLGIERYLHSNPLDSAAGSMISSHLQKSHSEEQDGMQSTGASRAHGADDEADGGGGGGIDLDISAISQLSNIPMATPSSDLKLGESSGRFGEIVVPFSGLTPSPQTSSLSKRTRRMAAAKPAFQRRLLDDL